MSNANDHKCHAPFMRMNFFSWILCLSMIMMSVALAFFRRKRSVCSHYVPSICLSKVNSGGVRTDRSVTIAHGVLLTIQRWSTSVLDVLSWSSFKSKCVVYDSNIVSSNRCHLLKILCTSWPVMQYKPFQRSTKPNWSNIPNQRHATFEQRAFRARLF